MPPGTFATKTNGLSKQGFYSPCWIQAINLKKSKRSPRLDQRTPRLGCRIRLSAVGSSRGSG